MKKITLLMLTSAISLLTLAQGKLTADAQWRIARQKAQAMRLETEGQMKVGKKGSDCGTWVVEVAEKNVAETFEQMRAAGATVCSKLGHLAVISIPFDSLESLQRIARGEVRLLAGDGTGFTLGFSEKPLTRDLGLAVSVPAFEWTWAADGRSLRVDYASPASGEVTAFLFRCVDAEGNMLGGPKQYTIPAE